MPTPLKTIAKFPWKEQAVWFLNGFWEDHKLGDLKVRPGEEDKPAYTEAEKIFQILKKFVSLDEESQRAHGHSFLTVGKTRDEFVIGSDLDEFWAHRVLETFNETLTVVEMREALKAIDATKDGYVLALFWPCFWRFTLAS